MMSTATALAPLALGALLLWSGVPKLGGRSAERQAAGSALERAFGDLPRAARALRAVGAAELLVAAGLLAGYGRPLTGLAAAGLGMGFTAYLGWAKRTAPESSCGCTARDDAPIGVRAFLRAGLVVAGGAAATAASAPWWAAAADRPAAAAAMLAVAALAVAVLFTEPDRYLLPLRRLRLRALGHPLAGDPSRVPVEASVELLERSLAWEAAAGIVRSGLLEHWDEDGWRFLRYSGVREEGAGTRQVSALFALDARATVDNAGAPAVRVTIVDDETQQPVPDALPDLSGRRPLRLVT